MYITKEEFINLIKEENDVIITKVNKNGFIKTGISLNNNANIRPQLYVEEFIDKIENEDDLIRIKREIIDTLEEETLSGEKINIESILNKEKILENVVLTVGKASAVDKNTFYDIDKNTPEIAKVYRVIIDMDKKGIGSYKVTKELLNTTGITEEEIREKALENIKSEAKWMSMKEVLEDMCGMPIEDEIQDVSMFVLSNNSKTNGAGQMYNTDVLKEIANFCESKELYILPSSIHELIIIPSNISDQNPMELREMVKEVNDTQVAEEDILSYEIYLYNSETETVRTY